MRPSAGNASGCMAADCHRGGWAFGFGIERRALRACEITGIRRFSENDLRFLRLF